MRIIEDEGAGGRSSLELVGGGRLEGALRVPGDKSISHRALLLGSVAEGSMPVSGLSPAADVASSSVAVQTLGVKVEAITKSTVELLSSRALEYDWEVMVHGSNWDGLASSRAPVDVRNSGTTIRVLLGILAGSRARATLTGDASIRRRPMARVVDPLRRMGADIDGRDGGDLAPLTVRGRPLRGAEHELTVASAQVKTALLMAGLRASGETAVREPARSRDHTERMLKYLGVQISESGNRYSVKSTKIRSAPLTIPGDFSSAAFLLAGAAILPGSRVHIEGVGLNPTRTAFLDILRRYGASVHVESRHEECGEPRGAVEVAAGDRRPIEVGPEDVPVAIDELPLVAVLGAFAEGESRVYGAAELRVKESDRVTAIVDGLRRMGVDIRAQPDGFTIRGGPRPRGTTVSSHGDHRIAMALAVAALGTDGGTAIGGWDAVAVSYPGFEADLARLRTGI